MTSTIRLATLVSVGLSLTGVAAEARWRIDAGGGAFIPTHDITLADDEGGVNLDPDVGASFVVGGGYGLGDWVDLTAQFQSSFTGLDLVFAESLDVYSFTAGARVYLMSPQRFRPWLAGGLGWYRTDAAFDSPFSGNDFHDTDDSFGINVGGGFDVAVNRRVSLGIDVRYHNAFDAFGGTEFVTTLFNVGIHFGTASPSGSPPEVH